jgi:WXG100 family type VII secretion target
MARLGGDIEGMERLQAQLKQKGEQVRSLRSELTNIVQGTYWEGAAATRFKDAWNGQYSSSLTKLEQLLAELGQEVKNRKDALVQVSA